MRMAVADVFDDEAVQQKDGECILPQGCKQRDADIYEGTQDIKEHKNPQQGHDS